MPYIHETFLVYKLKTFKTCKDVWHIIIIMIIAIIYIFFILCDIWSTVENYFQKILSLTLQKSTPPSLITLPRKNSKSASPSFLPRLKIVQLSPLQKVGDDSTREIAESNSVPGVLFNQTCKKIGEFVLPAHVEKWINCVCCLGHC